MKLIMDKLCFAFTVVVIFYNKQKCLNILQPEGFINYAITYFILYYKYNLFI